MERLIGSIQDLDHEAELLGYIRQIKDRTAERERRRLLEVIRSAQARGDDSTADEAARTLRQLQSTEKARGQRSPT